MWNLGNCKSFLLAPRRRKARLKLANPARLFFWNLQQEVHLPCDFVVHPIRWDRCPLVAAHPHARSWLILQSHRGLAYNTLDAYSRALERYLGFLGPRQFSCSSVTRSDIGLYLSSLQAGGSRLSNATIQQLLTVVRLFHAYLMEEGGARTTQRHRGTER